MKVDEFVEASERQTELLEELQKIIKSLEEVPADYELNQRIKEILRELRGLRSVLSKLSEEAPEGDIALLQEFYKLVGVHDEKEILEELLKMSIKGKIEVPQEEIISDIRELKKLAKELENVES